MLRRYAVWFALLNCSAVVGALEFQQCVMASCDTDACVEGSCWKWSQLSEYKCYELNKNSAAMARSTSGLGTLADDGTLRWKYTERSFCTPECPAATTTARASQCSGMPDNYQPPEGYQKKKCVAS
jgi:hypothetical protein